MQASSGTDPSKLRRRGLGEERRQTGEDMLITDHSVVMQDVANGDEGEGDQEYSQSVSQQH